MSGINLVWDYPKRGYYDGLKPSLAADVHLPSRAVETSAGERHAKRSHPERRSCRRLIVSMGARSSGTSSGSRRTLGGDCCMRRRRRTCRDGGGEGEASGSCVCYSVVQHTHAVEAPAGAAALVGRLSMSAALLGVMARTSSRIIAPHLDKAANRRLHPLCLGLLRRPLRHARLMDHRRRREPLPRLPQSLLVGPIACRRVFQATWLGSMMAIRCAFCVMERRSRCGCMGLMRQRKNKPLDRLPRIVPRAWPSRKR